MKSFSGRYAYRSNFHISKITVFDTVLGDLVTYPDAERIYQAAKFNTRELRLMILNTKTPGEAKRLASKHKDRIIPDWTNPESESYCVKVMEKIQRLKYSQNTNLKNKLVLSDDKIVEYNYWHDNFWGHCDCKKCKDIPKQNHLGNILMKLREEYRK